MSFEKETGRDLYFAQLEKELAELIDKKTGKLSLKYSSEVPCPLCQSEDYEEIFIKRGYTFVRCLECGMVFSNPQVRQDVVKKFYQDEQLSTELWMKILINQKETAWRNDYFEGILEKIQAFVNKGNLLDVGCAVGQFLKIAQEKGWKTTGLELNKTAVSYCKNKLGLNVIDKTIEDAGLNKGSFNAVSLLGVLEHVTDPVEMINSCKALISENGVIAVIVPNVYSLANSLFHEKAVTFDGRNHLLYFSESTLKKLFSDTGMEVVFSDTVLTGIPNIIKYLQYIDPYCDDSRTQFLPEYLQTIFSSGQETEMLERFIIDRGLGLRLRMVARKN